MKRLYWIGWGGGGERGAKPYMTAPFKKGFGETHRRTSCDKTEIGVMLLQTEKC